jgi:hypothetical protein
LNLLGLASSEKQTPQVIENFGSGDERKETLESAELRPRQVRYQAALRPDMPLILADGLNDPLRLTGITRTLSQEEETRS